MGGIQENPERSVATLADYPDVVPLDRERRVEQAHQRDFGQIPEPVTEKGQSEGIPGHIEQPLAENDEKKAAEKEERRERKGTRSAEFEPGIVGERYAAEYEDQGPQRREGHGGYELVLFTQILGYQILLHCQILSRKYNNFATYPLNSPTDYYRCGIFRQMTTFISQARAVLLSLPPYNI